MINIPMKHIGCDRYNGKRMESVQSSNSSKIAISAIWGHFRANQKLSRWTTVKKNATNQVLKLFLKILICRLRFLHSDHRSKLFYNCSAPWGGLLYDCPYAKSDILMAFFIYCAWKSEITLQTFINKLVEEAYQKLKIEVDQCCGQYERVFVNTKH